MAVETRSPGRAISLDDPAQMPTDRLEHTELVEELLRLRRLAAQVEARSSELIDSAARRGIPQVEGFGSVTGWLVALTGDPAAVCRSRVAVARSLAGMTITRRAFSSGDLSEPRVRMLAQAYEFAPGVFCRDEGLLVGQARSLPAKVFPRALAHWRRLADPDGALAEADRAFERCHLHVSATWAGMVRLDGDLDPESGAVVMTALGSLADPGALDPADRRTPPQRRADALVEICRRHLDSADRPQVGGERPHLLVTVSLASLQGPADGLVDLEAGPISLEAVRRLACDAAITPVVTGVGPEPPKEGCRTRVVPPALRRALNHRDGGCTHPGCQVPARWCDAHHLHHWADGGRTEADNPPLVCHRTRRSTGPGLPGLVAPLSPDPFKPTVGSGDIFTPQPRVRHSQWLLGSPLEPSQIGLLTSLGRSGRVMVKRSQRVSVATAVVASVVLAACGHSISVVADPGDLIRDAKFIDWEDLPAEAQEVRPPIVEGAGFLGEPATEYWGVAVVLPGSESRRLLITVWHNACRPAVTVAALDPTGAHLSLSIADAETNCADMLKMWRLEVTLNRDVDPSTLVVEVRDNRPQPLTRILRGVEGTLMARALARACGNWPGGDGCPLLPLCLVEPVESELLAAVEEGFPTGVMLVDSLPHSALIGGAPGAECLVMYLDYGVQYQSESVVGWRVWIGNTAHTYWFQWEDSVWVDVSPEQAGITDTTAIP
jgi:hypothetical protein